jgi:hypothetical protein
MTPLRQQMMTALELSGKSQRTQQSYARFAHFQSGS